MNALANIFGSLPDPLLAMLLGLAVLAFTLMRMSRRRRAARVDGRAGHHADLHNSRRETQAREDIDELMVRLEELSREICGQIDTRFAKLEHLLTRAERTLAALKPAESPAASPAGPADPPAEVPPPEADPKHEEIWALAAQGRPAVEIARQAGMTIGEVELVLSLERSRRRLLGLPETSAADGSPAGPGDDDDASARPARRRNGKPTRKGDGLDARA